MSSASDNDDPWYALGASFLKLPARATRDGIESGSVVGTAIHVELYGPADARAPRQLCVAIEPASGTVVTCHAVDATTGFVAYEEVLWSVIGAYMDSSPTFKPACLTTTDPALADYMFGLLQGSGTDVMCVGATQRVQWPSLPHLAQVQGLAMPSAADDSAARDVTAPTVSAVMHAALASLVASGRAAATLGQAPAAAATAVADDASRGLDDADGLVLLGACHHGECGKLLPRTQLKRCSACKVTTYCSAACQLSHWRAPGGHKKGCKDLQQINASKQTGGGVVLEG